MSTPEGPSTTSKKVGSHTSTRTNRPCSRCSGTGKSCRSRSNPSKSSKHDGSHAQSIHPPSRRTSTSKEEPQRDEKKKNKLTLSFTMNLGNMSRDMKMFVQSLQIALEKGARGRRLVDSLRETWSQQFFVSKEAQNTDEFYHMIRTILVSNEVNCNYSRLRKGTPVYQRIIKAIWPEDLKCW